MTVNFSNWLLDKMRERDWSQADLARASGLTRQAISYYLGDKSKSPDNEALKNIARALKIPPEQVFRAAGLLPPAPEHNRHTEKLLYWFNQLDDEAQEEYLAELEFRISRKKERQRPGVKRHATTRKNATSS